VTRLNTAEALIVPQTPDLDLEAIGDVNAEN